MVNSSARGAVVGFMRCSGVLPAMPGSGTQDGRGVFVVDTAYNSPRDLSRAEPVPGPASAHPHHAEPHEEFSHGRCDAERH